MGAVAEPRGRTGAAGRLSFRVHDRIGDVDPAEWDSLVPAGDLLASHRFIRVCQESGIEDALYRHVLIERRGRLVAVASLSSMRVSLDLLSSGRTRAMIRWARRWSPSFLNVRVVLCGLPVSSGSSSVRIRPGEDPEPIVEGLAAVTESFAGEVSAGLVCFKELTNDEAAACAGLSRRGYLRASSLPSCTLPITWRSFDEYLTSLRSGYRRQIRASLEAARSAGLAIRSVEDFAVECPRLFALYEQVMDRAEHRLERLGPRFFERLNDDLGARSRALLVEREGRLVAAAILLEAPLITTFLLAGIDYEASRAWQGYPFLVTRIVADAIERGSRALDLGQTSYRLKGRLGAIAEPRWIYLRHRANVPNALLRAASGTLFPATAPPARRVFRD